jgi:hypothetical protein
MINLKLFLKKCYIETKFILPKNVILENSIVQSFCDCFWLFASVGTEFDTAYNTRAGRNEVSFEAVFNKSSR